MQAQAANTSGWIVSPRFDLAFFFGSAALGIAAGVLALALPAILLPMWFLWLWMVDGPHLVATWQRTYLDATCRREQRALLLGSLAWLLPGPIALGITLATGSEAPFALFLAFAALWSFHHAVRQHHGVLSIYQRLGKAQPTACRTDRYFLHGLLWSGFALFLLAHPANRAMLDLAWIPAPVSALLALLISLGLLSWCVMLVQRWRAGSPVKPGLFGLVAAVGTTLFALLFIGMREPLLAAPVNPEQMFMASTLVGGTLHGVQYLGIVIATSRRRALGDPDPASLPARLGRAPIVAYLLMLAVSLGYIALTILRGATAPSIGPDAQLFLGLYWGLFFHHYWLDQKIWKPSTDPRLRAELGMES